VIKKSGEKRSKTSICPKKVFYTGSVNNQNESLSPLNISIQNWLRPDLTPVLRNRDHQRLAEDIEKLDSDLCTSGLEAMAMSFAIEAMGAA